MTGFTYVAGDARRFSGFSPISTPSPSLPLPLLSLVFSNTP